MSIDISTAMTEVSKFGTAKLDYPPEMAGVKVLAKALAKHAKSEQHAAAVIESWIEHWPNWPKPSELTQMCQSVNDPTQDRVRVARENCERCQGNGWITVQGPFGTSAAYPCTHAPETESDRRMGVRIPPAVANHYREEAVNAEPRRQLHVGSGGHVNQSELTRVNLATIGKLVHGFETGERRESNS